MNESITELLTTLDVYAPPVDAMQLARRMALNIIIDAEQVGRARLVSWKSQRASERPTIFVRPEARLERMQWAIAHEIGEWKAAAIARALTLTSDDLTNGCREHLANRFASHLLLPTVWFAKDVVRSEGDLFALKRIYTTASHELIARRMLDLRVPQIVTVIDNGCITWRESNLPGRTPPLFALEQSCRRAAQPCGMATLNEDFTVSVQAWRIVEQDWSREILRTCLHGEEY